jgi:hypothetical protein
MVSLLCAFASHRCCPRCTLCGEPRLDSDNSPTWPCRTAVRHCLPVCHSGPDFHTLHRGLWNSMSSHETSWNYSETLPIFEKCVCYILLWYYYDNVHNLPIPARDQCDSQSDSQTVKYNRSRLPNLRNNIWFIVIRCHALSLILQSPCNFVFWVFLHFFRSGSWVVSIPFRRWTATHAFRTGSGEDSSGNAWIAVVAVTGTICSWCNWQCNDASL